jgi:putative ABC transport system permease protein
LDRKNYHQPRLAEWLISSLIRQDFREDVLGDLEESFQDNLESHNLFLSRLKYWYQVLNYLRPFAIKSTKTQNTNTMFRHFFKLSWRQIQRNRGFSAIEIGGFAVGIAACILIFLFIGQQTSYDSHYSNKDRIYRLVNYWSQEGDLGYWSNVHGPLKEVLEDNIPEMEKVARVVLWTWGDAGENHVRRIESDFNHFHDGFIYADPELLDILEIPMIYGSQKEALAAPDRIVISQKIAELYYPGENPTGKQIILNDNPQSTFMIGGVMENLPESMHLRSDFIMTLFERKTGPGTSGWCCTNYNMYVRLTPQADKGYVEQKTATLRNTFVIDKLREVGASGLEDELKYQSFYLQPVSNIFINPEKVGDDLPHGSTELVWIFGVTAFIVLLLATVNFVNMATARSIKRAKEVGMLKVVGSVRSTLIVQYLTESILYCFFSLLLGLVIAWGLLDTFNDIAGTSIQMPWLTWWFLPTLLLTTLIIGLLAGLYPAFYLSRFRPVEVLKGEIKKGRKASYMRSALVIFQFTATTILIVSALVIHRQFEFLMNKSLGYEKEQVINIQGLETMDESKKLAFKAALQKESTIIDATLSDFMPVEGSAIHNRSYWLSNRRQVDNGLESARWTVDEDYIQTMGITLLAGRNFRPGESNGESLIVNESMVKALQLDNPIGVQLIDMFDQKHTIIGVVSDFHFESMLTTIRPLVFVYGHGKGTLSLRLDGKSAISAMPAVERVWEQFNANQNLRYSFMEERFERMYDMLARARTLFLTFAVLSITIACLGLFALSVYMLEQRSKEITIRKVLGANSARLFTLVAFDFIKLVLIALVIALPISWKFMEYLLEDIANRISLDWPIFMLAGLLAIAVAILTVGYESLKAALANPAGKLRSE